MLSFEANAMTNPTGESTGEALRLDFDRRLMLQFRGSVVTSNAGLLAYRELDDTLGLSKTAGEMLADGRTGKNGRHALDQALRGRATPNLDGITVPFAALTCSLRASYWACRSKEPTLGPQPVWRLVRRRSFFAKSLPAGFEDGRAAACCG
jgi:hypothetical protein